jgi:very-short-patch-repair endonuclease
MAGRRKTGWVQPQSQIEATRERMIGNTLGQANKGRLHSVEQNAATSIRMRGTQNAAGPHRVTEKTLRARREIIGPKLHRRWTEDPPAGWTKRTYRLTELCLDLAAHLLVAGHELVAEVQFGKYRVDLYDPVRHVAFEADGDYWHAMPGRAEYDARRDAELLRRFGLSVVRFSEHEIKGFAQTQNGIG